MENYDNFLLGQFVHDDVKFWSTSRVPSSSSSSQGFSECHDQNLSEGLSCQNRPRKTNRLQNSTKKVPTNSLLPIQRPKRKKSSEKERQRNLQIKQYMKTLTTLLPGVKSEIPRIRTLRLANRYIVHLGRILREEQIFCEQSQTWRRLTIEDFERTVSEEMQTSNSYKERAEMEMISSGAEMTTTTASPTSTAHSVPHTSVGTDL
ncbi:hypothetical protein niasHS_000978 [Heterodera schachtii]|uniref:BHLH domain-containing protein n=1 Tax=Heterodera schachtii TaxID=97005 RepID=A0ABD2K7V9_HETSC